MNVDAPSSSGSIYVDPGRTVASAGGLSLVTVVGSGAAVCVWDPFRGVGGMSHFLLPEAGNAPAATRFGDVAMKKLLSELARLGADLRRLRARVFGGSTPPLDEGSGNVGDRNIQSALAFLVLKSVMVVDRDVGGKGVRRIVFDSRRGTAEVAKIGSA